jgi:hypothetical protein
MASIMRKRLKKGKSFKKIFPLPPYPNIKKRMRRVTGDAAKNAPKHSFSVLQSIENSSVVSQLVHIYCSDDK